MSKIRRCIVNLATLSVACILSACSEFQPLPTAKIQPATPDTSETIPAIPLVLDSISSLVDESSRQEVPTPTVSQDSSLVHALAERFHKPETLIQRVVNAATRFADGNFPLRNDILAIIAVESSFNPFASYNGSKGLMQIQTFSHKRELADRNPYNIEANIEIGASILRQYSIMLHGNERAAVLAYNCGIGNYQHHHYKTIYYKKYLAELNFIRSISV
jgi:hypothetical protein